MIEERRKPSVHEIAWGQLLMFLKEGTILKNNVSVEATVNLIKLQMELIEENNRIDDII